MDFDIHCMFILPTELLLFNYDKVKSVLQSIAPLIVQCNDNILTTVQQNVVKHQTRIFIKTFVCPVSGQLEEQSDLKSNMQKRDKFAGITRSNGLLSAAFGALCTSNNMLITGSASVRSNKSMFLWVFYTGNC